MSELLELDDDKQTPSEYALVTWSRMTDQGFAPLDSLKLIEARLKRRQVTHPSRDSAQALKLVDKWRGLVSKAKTH